MRTYLSFTVDPEDAKFDPVAIAASLRSLLAEYAQQAEQERQIVAPVFKALRESGLLRMMAPRRAGGFSCSIITHMRTIAELAKGCAGTAWAFGLLSGVTGAAAAMPPEATQILFKSGEELFCSVSSKTATATPTDGGYLVTGSWGYGSGCMHADWAINAVLINDSNGNQVDLGFAIIPINGKEVVIEDTWHVAGVKASGSNTIVATSIFVPHCLMMPNSILPNSTELLSMSGLEPRDRRPMEPQFPLGVLSPTLGAAEAMLELISSKMGNKKIAGWQYDNQVSSQTFVQQLGEAAMEIDSAWLHIERAASGLDEKAQVQILSGYDKAQIQADCSYAMELLRRATGRLMDIAGPSGFIDNSPLQRHWRDVSFASRHTALHTHLSLELYGRARLELPSNLLLLPDISQ